MTGQEASGELPITIVQSENHPNAPPGGMSVDWCRIWIQIGDGPWAMIEERSAVKATRMIVDLFGLPPGSTFDGKPLQELSWIRERWEGAP
jgi:hypothetical protein